MSSIQTSTFINVIHTCLVILFTYLNHPIVFLCFKNLNHRILSTKIEYYYEKDKTKTKKMKVSLLLWIAVCVVFICAVPMDVERAQRVTRSSISPALIALERRQQEIDFERGQRLKRNPFLAITISPSLVTAGLTILKAPGKIILWTTIFTGSAVAGHVLTTKIDESNEEKALMRWKLQCRSNNYGCAFNVARVYAKWTGALLPHQTSPPTPT